MYERERGFVGGRVLFSDPVLLLSRTKRGRVIDKRGSNNLVDRQTTDHGDDRIENYEMSRRG